MCEVYDRAEQKGIAQGIQQKRDLDIRIIKAIRKGKTVEEIADAMTETLS